MEHNMILPAEWYPQNAVQLTRPYKDTDQALILDEVIPCFVAAAREVIKRERLLIVCPDETTVRERLGEADYDRITFREMGTNDMWARGHRGISVFDEGTPVLYDFIFNGQGIEFAANHGSLITRSLYRMKTFFGKVMPANMRPFVPEGSSIESDGKGTLVTAVEYLASVNHNEYLQREELERYLKGVSSLDRILWITSGYLTGDDTDNRVNILVCFCSEDAVACVRCEDEENEHYKELKAMEEETREFTRANGEPYRLIPLPMAGRVEWEGERLPTTHANFLIMSGTVLVPFYDLPKDEITKTTLRGAFPDHEVVGIDCLPLTKRHGSLHYVTMRYPENFIE